MRTATEASRLVVVCLAVILWTLWATYARADPCPVPPDLTGGGTAVGSPFFDCGFGPEDFSAPDPTRYPHAFGDSNADFSHSVTCFKPFTTATWWEGNEQPDIPDIYVRHDDRVIYSDAIFPGDVIFTGQRVQFQNVVGFGSATGDYVCAPGADQIEVDGECLCPVPEPGMAVGLAAGCLGVAVSRRALLKGKAA